MVDTGTLPQKSTVRGSVLSNCPGETVFRRNCGLITEHVENPKTVSGEPLEAPKSL